MKGLSLRLSVRQTCGEGRVTVNQQWTVPVKLPPRPFYRIHRPLYHPQYCPNPRYRQSFSSQAILFHFYHLKILMQAIILFKYLNYFYDKQAYIKHQNLIMQKPSSHSEKVNLFEIESAQIFNYILHYLAPKYHI